MTTLEKLANAKPNVSLKEVPVLISLARMSKTMTHHVFAALDSVLLDIEREHRNAVRDRLVVDQDFWLMVIKSVVRTEQDRISPHHIDVLREVILSWKTNRPPALELNSAARLGAAGWWSEPVEVGLEGPSA